MKNLVVSMIASGAKAQLSGGKVGELLQYFESNQQRYQVNVEQYCRFGDLPIMELTSYQCLDVIEESLTDGKACSFTCKNDPTQGGTIECICDNTLGAVAENAMCKWKFPAYTSQCGPARMQYVDAELADLKDGNLLREKEIGGLDVQMANLQSYVDNTRQEVADVSGKVDRKNAEVLMKLAQDSVQHNTARASMEAKFDSAIGDLQAADLALSTVVTSNGNVLSDVVDMTDEHAEQLMIQKQNITSIMQTVASQTIDILSLETELDQEAGALLTALNTQILKQETDRAAMQDNINDNYAHLTLMDATLNDEILRTKSDLNDEVTRGGVRDQRLLGHDDSLMKAGNDIITNNELIMMTQRELNDKFAFLTNYTNTAVNSLSQQVSAEMDTLEYAMNAADDHLAADDEAIRVSLNNTQADLDAEEARGDAQDATLAAHAANMVDLATDIAANVEGINTVQQNLDHEVEVMGLNLNMTEAKLQANINALQGAVELADQELQNNIDATNQELTLTSAALDAEVARGSARDIRLDEHQSEITILHDDMSNVETALDDTMVALMANDTRLEGVINQNMADLTQTISDLGTELRAVDSALNETDVKLRSDLTDTQTSLNAEIVRGQGRDETLQQHHDRLVAAEVDLVDKQSQLDTLSGVVAANHKTAMDTIADTKHELEHAMEHLEEELTAVDEALADADDELGHRIDHTDANLAIEKGRNDAHDATLLVHNNKLAEHTDELARLDEYIEDVNDDLIKAVETIGNTIDTTKAALDDSINDLRTEMNAADAAQTVEDQRLQGEIDDTNDDLTNEKKLGLQRDARLNDNNVRLTVLRSNTDTNTAGMNKLTVDLDTNTKKLSADIRNSTAVLNEKLYQTDRKLTLADAELAKEDLNIRGDMTKDKFALETKINSDILTADRAVRTHFNNEIFRMDNKFTNSINALAKKEQEDIDDIHAALDFFWGIYRPTKIVLIDGVFQPTVGHLLTVLPHLYRVWQIEVDIMPYKKNHYSWVNLLHFTASGDNYGKAGDRMPLVSFYPGENILHIACYINNEVSYAYDSDYQLPMNRWTKLTIGQAFVQDQYVYYVKINDKQVYSVINYYPRDFANLMVYGSDPWTEQANAKLRNLIFTTSWGGSIISRTDPIGPQYAGIDRSINGTIPADVSDES